MKTEGSNRIATVVAELRESTRKDLAAAWNDRLRASWQEEVDRALRARLSDAARQLEEALQFEVGWHLAAELDAAAPGIASRAKREVAESINRTVRRLIHHANEAEWIDALLDGAAGFARRVAFFAVRGDTLAGSRDVVEVPLDRAPAFRNVVESGDTVVALKTPGELSAEIAALSEEPEGSRCYLFPVRLRGCVEGILYADGETADPGALEALAAVAGLTAATIAPADTEEEFAAPEPEPGGETGTETGAPALISIAPAPQRRLTVEEHRALEFARVRVAQIVLDRHAALRAGRERRNVYGALREEIESARDVYARHFPSEVDYLHSELVRALANGDQQAMGEDYPGPLR